MIDYGTPRNITDSAILATSQGRVLGFYVNSTSTGIIQLYDTNAADTANAISGAITPAIGWHFFPAAFANGLRVVKNSGTINITVMVC